MLIFITTNPRDKCTVASATPKFRTAQVYERWSVSKLRARWSIYTTDSSILCSTPSKRLLPPQGQHVKDSALGGGGRKETHSPIHLAVMQDCHLEDFRREARSHQLISLKHNYFLHEVDVFPLFPPNSRWLLISFIIRKVKTWNKLKQVNTLLNSPKRSANPVNSYFLLFC